MLGNKSSIKALENQTTWLHAARWLCEMLQRSCNITQKQMNLLTLYFPRFLKKTHKGIMTTPGVPNYLAL
jgi:hypothetical protein